MVWRRATGSGPRLAGKIAAPSLTDKVIKVLLRDGLIRRFKGEEGLVYAPVRSHAGRMKRMLEELKASADELWNEIGTLA
jgi:hypothetical protein